MNQNGQIEKLCTGCDSFKTFDFFNKHKGRPFGLDTRCRECYNKKPSILKRSEEQKKDRIEAKGFCTNQSLTTARLVRFVIH